MSVSPDAATGVILRIVAALPTPELRAGAFLAVLTHTVRAQRVPLPQSRPAGAIWANGELLGNGDSQAVGNG